ncbi:MAG TPA: hypothetical protein PKD38_16615 [Nitrospira sp.]|nr:hypothetical protein [Nitrospira sp.]
MLSSAIDALRCHDVVVMDRGFLGRWLASADTGRRIGSWNVCDLS